MYSEKESMIIRRLISYFLNDESIGTRSSYDSEDVAGQVWYESQCGGRI